jgi:hypothetical protein
MGKEDTMRYLSEDELTQVMGLGYVGEVRQGPDGRLYQWVEGIDGLGNPVGSWLRRLRRGVQRFVRKAMPIAKYVAPFVPGGAAALTVATPILQRAGVAGGNGLGALYEAPDGSLYQVQGLAEEEELRGLGQEEPAQMMGQGYLGEVRQDLEGNLYQWVEGVDGLGNPVGSWLKRLRRGVQRFVRKAMPIAKYVAPFVPGGAAALTVATPILQRAGVAGGNGLGALYEGPDGSLYQVQGMAEEEELRGFAEEDELRGFAEEEELRGLDEEEELRGFAEEEELRGFAEDEELRGFAEEEELRGLEQGYVRQDEIRGLEAYLPEQPPRTNWFTPAAQAPRKRTLQWDPLW